MISGIRGEKQEVFEDRSIKKKENRKKYSVTAEAGRITDAREWTDFQGILLGDILHSSGLILLNTGVQCCAGERQAVPRYGNETSLRGDQDVLHKQQSQRLC